MRLLSVRGLHMDLTPAIEQAVRTRVEALAKYTRGVEPAEVTVEVGRSSAHHQKGDVFVAEFSARVGESSYRIETSAGDLYIAIDQAQEDLKRQIVAGKEKRGSRLRRLGQTMKGWMRGD